MPTLTGRFGAVYSRNGTTDLAGAALAQVGATNEYVLSDAALRVARAFDADAELADFTPSSGTITAIRKPVGAVTISGGTPPYTLSSANQRVVALTPVAGFLDWRLEVDQSVVDVTTLGMAHRTHRRLLRGWNAEADRFWLDPNFTPDAPTSMTAFDDASFVVSFFVNTESANYYRYVGFAAMDGAGIGAEVEGLAREALRFRGQGELHFRRASD